MRKLLYVSLLAASATVFAERWDGANHPNNFSRIAGASLKTTFEALPLVGRLSDNRYGWSGTYWPANLGGIAYRWNHPNPQPFKYKFHSKEELMSMSLEQLGQLSPAELYDLSQGNYHFPFTRLVLRQFSTRDLWWEGICHGWAQAAGNYAEPRQVVVRNPDGLRVPFGSSDVKALLAMHEAYNFKGTSQYPTKFGFIGKRCRVNGKVVGEEDDRDGRIIRPSPQDANSPDCKDVNAGSFHVTVSNMIGIFSKGFVTDIDRFNDVWNQPITGFDSQILAEEPVEEHHRSYGVARRVRIATKFIYGEELQLWTPEKAAQHPDWRHWVSKEPVTGTPLQQFKSKNYEYIVEVDGNGQVIGGEWISETRPDFMWHYTRTERFVNARMPLAGLNSIYRPVRR